MRWLDPPAPVETPLLEDLPPLLAQILLRRGVSSRGNIRSFLDPNAYQPTPASVFPGMEAAVARIAAAIQAGERICIWGDFDVDGQTATAVLHEGLQALGAKTTFILPLRAQEGHGVHLPKLEQVIHQGAQLIITCDTGINAHEAVEYARGCGVSTVITDHHELGESLPAAEAVINPRLLPDNHPLASLSGVGVAYKLVEGMMEQFAPGNKVDLSNRLLDLVALGTVADMAPLRGEARYLVQRGLEVLRQTSRQGLLALLERAELRSDKITEEQIGFIIAPRLNALGRLGDANPAVEFLVTHDPVRAQVLAVQLENYNAQRQLLCSQVYRAAEAQLAADPALLTQAVIILAHKEWPAGVIGIVASQLVQRYHRPAILFSAPEGESMRGSARSIEGIHITAAISSQAQLLQSYGGHPMAAGLSLDPGNLSAFRRGLMRAVDRMTAGEPREAVLQVDAWLSLPEADLELAATLERLAPFGMGNPKPILATRRLRATSSTVFGRNLEHRKISVEDDAGNIQTVLWWDGGVNEAPEGKFDLAYTLRASDWRGEQQISLEYLDSRLIEDKPVEIKKSAPVLIDHRGAEDPLTILTSLPAETLIWAEGDARKQVNGVDRTKLVPARSFAIWTTPPGATELRNAIRVVSPQTVYLFGIDPPNDEARSLLEKLAGISKFVINQRAGETSISELAAATAQRESVVRAGLSWLAANGSIAIRVKEGGILSISASAGSANAGTSPGEVEYLLAETQAYRQHFHLADPGSLLG